MEQRLARVSSVYDRPPATTTTTTAGAPDWRTWFPAAEYENPWDHGSRRLRPLAFTPADTASKHVIALLQTYHHFEHSVTTGLCNTVLHNLHDLMGPLQHNQKKNQPQNQHDQIQNQPPPQRNYTAPTVTDADQTVRIAERALAILENMELFDAIPVPADQKLPRALPKPNRETYNAVLLIYSRAAGPRLVPDTAAAIVNRMQYRYDVHHDLDMRPICFHWNCVLLAWKNCSDADKAAHALQLLLRTAASDPALVDASSYVHVLRVCAHGHRDADAALRGAAAAIQLWQTMFERGGTDKDGHDGSGGGSHNDSDYDHESHHMQLHRADATTASSLPEMPSHFYSHFLQAIRPLPTGSDVRDDYYAACFQRACDEGKLNVHVLSDFFIHAKSKLNFEHFLGIFAAEIFGMPAQDAVRRILLLAPAEWTARADG